MSIPLTYNVSASLSAGITKVAEPNPNIVCLMTNEPNSFTKDVGDFFNASDIGKFWGVDSVTYQMANQVFGQTPGILAGGGFVKVVKMDNTTDGTVATIKTVDLSSKIDAFKAVTDGALTFSINGNVKKSVFIDLSSVNTVTDIAEILELKAFGYSVSGDNDTGEITFSTKIAGSAVTFINVAAESGTDLADATLLDLTAATETAGTDPTGETIPEVLVRLDGKEFFHGIITTKVMTPEEKNTTAEAIMGQPYLFYPDIAGDVDARIVGENVVGKSLWNTRLTSNLGEDILTAKKIAAGAVSKMFSGNPNMSNTALTMDNKIISGVLGNDKIGTTELAELIERGVDVYVKRNETLSTLITGNANKYTDVAYLSNLIPMMMVTNVFNTFLTDTKVPQEQAGRDRLRNAVAKVLDKLVRSGWLAQGETWNGETFGNDAEFRASIELNGYYIYIVPETTQADREKRKALIQVACKASGAYHGAQINITVEE